MKDRDMDGPAKISKYTVLNRLGTGGMAEVFKCRLSGVGGFEKLVVVKRILPHLVEDEAFVRMFLDEARIAANLNHPNIVQVYEIAQDDDGTPFIAMEFVRGPTLSQLMRKVQKAGDVHFGRVARLLAGASAGLDYAHNAKGPDGKPLNIVHRDVSPQNMLVSIDGVPKILDFGVAKAEGRLSHTQGGVMKGKLRYMAPEIMLSGGNQIDRRCDVFSLGVCLYVSTIGKLPFDGAGDTEVMKSIVQGEYVQPEILSLGYPAELTRIIKWALEPDPEQRCPNARALSEALLAFAVSTGPGASEQDIAAWMSKHFPDMDTDSWGSPSTQSPSGLSKLVARTSSPLIDGVLTGVVKPEGLPADGAVDVNMEMTGAGHVSKLTVAPKSKAPLFGALAIALLLAVGAVVAFTSPRPAPAPVPPPAAPQETSILPLLDEAAKALEAGKVTMGTELLAKARGRGRISAAEEVRLVQLEAQSRVTGKLVEARASLAEGKVEVAAAALEAVLHDEPANAAALELKGTLEARRVQATAVDAGAAVEPPAAVPTPGDLKGATVVSVSSTPPGAQVLVDDRPAGTTPLRSLKLAPGAHVVTVKKDGFEPFTESVRATGRALVVRATLKADAKAGPAEPAAKGSVRIIAFEEGEPTWANVTVDGKRVEKVTPLVLELAVGPHQLVVERVGFQTVSRTVEAQTGKTEVVRVELKP